MPFQFLIINLSLEKQNQFLIKTQNPSDRKRNNLYDFVIETKMLKNNKT